MRRARFLAPARREYIHEVKFYSEAGSGVGIRFAAAVEEATARALAFPQAGSPAGANTRKVFLKNFPFALVYRPEPAGILILALAHFSRASGYWVSRAR